MKTNRFHAQEFPKGEFTLFDKVTGKVWRMNNIDDVQEVVNMLNKQCASKKCTLNDTISIY